MINKKFTYEELDSLWEQTFKETKLVFSVYDYDEEDDTIIPLIDFTSTEPIIKGDFELSFHTWKYPEGLYVTKGVDLTWTKLIDILDEHADESHIFIETFQINENKVYVFLGS